MIAECGVSYLHFSNAHTDSLVGVVTRVLARSFTAGSFWSCVLPPMHALLGGQGQADLRGSLHLGRQSQADLRGSLDLGKVELNMEVSMIQ